MSLSKIDDFLNGTDTQPVLKVVGNSVSSKDGIINLEILLKDDVKQFSVHSTS